MDAAMLAGSFSTVLFVGSSLPMLAKAARTRDLDSYSRGQLVLANVGNVVNSVYVFSLPFGPIWVLHLFNLGCTLVMLVWHLRYAGRRVVHHEPDGSRCSQGSDERTAPSALTRGSQPSSVRAFVVSMIAGWAAARSHCAFCGSPGRPAAARLAARTGRAGTGSARKPAARATSTMLTTSSAATL
jgi:hypothetical protein